MSDDGTLDLIPLAIPELAGRELEYLEQCVRTGWVSSAGPMVRQFEQTVASCVGRKHGVAVVNGTAALHLALAVAGVEAGDEVIVPALSFIAPANAVCYVGAVPVYVDAEAVHWQIDVGRIAEFLNSRCESRADGTYNSDTGRRVKAVVPVHILGHPVDIKPLVELALEFKLVVIEDAAESLGARYEGGPVGSFGDIACFSFNGNKIVTAGGGGMLVTDDDELAARARHLSTQAKQDPVEYVHDEIGYNYRLTNIQAALGCAQMEQLEGFIATKRHIAERYSSAFSDIPGLTLMSEAPHAFSTYWLYTVLIDPDRGAGSRDVLARLAGQNIQARPLWLPLPHGPAGNYTADRAGCPVAERLHQESLSLPSWTAMSMGQVDRVIDVVSETLR